MVVGSGGGMGMDVAVSAMAIEDAGRVRLRRMTRRGRQMCTVRKRMARDGESRVGICVSSLLAAPASMRVSRKLRRGVKAAEPRAIARIKCRRAPRRDKMPMQTEIGTRSRRRRVQAVAPCCERLTLHR